MSFYDGYEFFGCLFLILIVAMFIGAKERSLKLYQVAISVLLILVTAKSTKSLLWFAFFIVLQLYTIKIYQWLRQKYGRKEWIYYHAVAFAIAPLVISKCAGFLPCKWFLILGISYVTFRTVQIIIELYDGVIDQVDTFETIAFLIFFPCLSSGPIDRSRRFSEDFNLIRPKNEYLDVAGKGIEKILIGMFYKFVVSQLLYLIVDASVVTTDVLDNIVYAYSYGFYMFFDFAGYSLMAIGTGYVLGIIVPENFDKPFISLDIKEFWDRWHISLSHWFRDFIFSRFMMKSIKKKWFKKRINGASAGFIVNMLVMGFWHGVCVDYVVYGLYHGILLAITERFQKKSKFYKKNKGKIWFKLGSWFLTLQFVMFGFYIFSGRCSETVNLIIYKIFN